MGGGGGVWYLKKFIWEGSMPRSKQTNNMPFFHRKGNPLMEEGTHFTYLQKGYWCISFLHFHLNNSLKYIDYEFTFWRACSRYFERPLQIPFQPELPLSSPLQGIPPQVTSDLLCILPALQCLLMSNRVLVYFPVQQMHITLTTKSIQSLDKPKLFPLLRKLGNYL